MIKIPRTPTYTNPMTGRVYRKWFAWYPVKTGLRRPDGSCLGKWYNGWRWLCFVDRGIHPTKDVPVIYWDL